MNLRVEITEADLKRLVIGYLEEQLGSQFSGGTDQVRFEVKSKQNFRSEWETAAFRAVYET